MNLYRILTVYNLLLASWKGNLGIFGYLGYNSVMCHVVSLER